MLLRQYLGVAGPSPEERPSVIKTWNILRWIIFFISIWLVIQFYLDINSFLNPVVRSVLIWVIWASFLFEILIMLIISEYKLYFLGSNWLIILVMLAAFPIIWYFSVYLAILRFFQTIVILVILVPWQIINRLLIENKLGLFLLICLLITVITGLLIGFVDPGIGGPWRGIWWAFQTITLVGYGDPLPNTVLGQLFSVIIMLLGVLLLALVSASIVKMFFRKIKKDEEITKVQNKLDIIEQKLDKIDRKNNEEE